MPGRNMSVMDSKGSDFQINHSMPVAAPKHLDYWGDIWLKKHYYNKSPKISRLLG